MKKSNIMMMGAWAVAACGAAMAAPVNVMAPGMPAPAASAQTNRAPANPATEAWSDPAKVMDTLAEKIMPAFKDLGNITPQQVSTFMSDDYDRLLIAQWLVAQNLAATAKQVEADKQAAADRLAQCSKEVEDIQATLPKNGMKPSHRQEFNLARAQEALAEAQAEVAVPRTMQEILASPKGRALMTTVLNSPDLMQKIAFSGEADRLGKVLGILTTIAEKYPDFDKDAMSRDIALATALEYGRYNWNAKRALDRYNYFARHYAEGDLNSVFDTIPFWQRRIVCGAKGDNDFCSVESLEWSLEHVALAQDQYANACWRCGYKLRNPYGESIHGALFGAPFDERYGRNRMWFTYEVGGVCGSLSHFGAYSACANGIPALTAGEPGHCAFVVLVGDKWTPAYSLSYERGLHWQVFKDVHMFSSLHMATDLFSDAQKKATEQSYAYMAIAGELARAGRNADARRAYIQAVTVQPDNFYAWRAYAGFIKTVAPKDAAAWSQLNDLVCKHVAPVYPEMAAEILTTMVYDDLAAAQPDKGKLTDIMLQFWHSVDGMGPDRWRIEELLSKQMQLIGVDETKVDSIVPFAGRIMKEISSKEAYLPVAFAWTSAKADKFEKQADKQRMLQTSVQALSGMKGDAAERVKTLKPLVLAAEKARDRATFQAIRKMLPEETCKSDIPAIEPFPGKLVSQGGLVFASSTSNFDGPCEHPFLLEPCGGRYHSSKDTDPWVAVELPKQANVNGIVVVLTSVFLERCQNVHVQISESGKDDDWHDVSVTERPGRIIRVDLQDKAPLAKYVRVLRAGGPEFFHLNGIFVYGKPAA